ncbi:unnamed protein product [Discula destructiva]
MSSTTFLIVTHLLLAAAVFVNGLQPHIHIHDRLLEHLIRDETFINTPGEPQNLCGESTFGSIGGEHGPIREDCASLHRTVEKNLHGFWMASKLGWDGTVWVEVTRLRSCGLKIRRTDGRSEDIACVAALAYISIEVPSMLYVRELTEASRLGDDDVADLVNRALNGSSGHDKIPARQGKMTCSKNGSSAAVEWMICAV